MWKWILAALSGIALFVQGFLHRRTETKLTQERDAALVNAAEAKIQAEGKTNEAARLRELQKKNAKTDALDGDDLLDDLNTRNR